MLERLINCLQEEFNISGREIALAQKTTNLEPNTLPLVLWQYGFLSIQELEQIFDWLEVS